MRWLSLIVVALFLGSATIADAQVFKPRGKGNKTTKSATAKKSTTSKTAAKKTTTPKRSAPAKKKAPAKGKVARARPSDLTPDPVKKGDADEDYVVIEDLADDDWR